MTDTDTLTVSQAAKRLNVSRFSIHSWIRKGLIKTAGKKGPTKRSPKLISEAELNRFVDEYFS